MRLPTNIEVLTGLGTPGRAAQRALALALDARIDPVPPDASAIPATVYLTPALFDGLVSANVPLSAMPTHAEGLIHAWALTERKSRAARAKAALPDPLGDLPATTLRAGQRTLLQGAIAPFDAGRVVFAEASTGVGKSRVIALLAEHARRHGRIATIAVPTVSLIAHMLAEFAELDLPAPSIYLGRRQFVSPALLAMALADPELVLPDAEMAALMRWDGSPIPGSPTTRLAAYVPGLAWLRDDLLHLSPGFPVDDVALGEGEPHESYEGIRATWSACPVRLVTHAALAADMRLRELGRDLLADSGDLLIDEAHLFEDAVGRAFSSSLSLHSLRLRLRAALADDLAELRKKRLISCAERLLAHTDDAVRTLSHSAPAGQYLIHAGSELGEQAMALRSALGRICDALAPDLQRAMRAGGILARRLADMTEAVDAIQSGKVPAVVTLSRVRRYPGIVAGRRSLGSVLAGLWARTRAATLVSATLFTDTAEHGISAGYHASLLHVPRHRIHEVPRVVAPWVYATATLHCPSAADASALIPPKLSTDDADEAGSATESEIEAYFDAVAAVLVDVAATAAGGALVLCTSYQAIKALAARLQPQLGARLIAQDSSISLAQGEHRFRDKGAAARPVWLATGGAWTGLDLRDSGPAHEDRLLTDVVIPRLPVQMPGTVYRLLRSARTGLATTRIEAALRLRQGMGRLVRAEGQPDRRLWVLDGRLWSLEAPNPYLCGPSLRAINAYPNRRTFGS